MRPYEVSYGHISSLAGVEWSGVEWSGVGCEGAVDSLNTGRNESEGRE